MKKKHEEERKRKDEEESRRKNEEESKKKADEEKRLEEEEEEDRRIEELEKRLELKKTEEAELILKEEKKLSTPKKIEEERQKIEEEAAESLQQIMAVKQHLQTGELKSQGDKKSSKPNQIFPTKVMVVNSNSFVPQKNTKHEIGVIKMGSPSQIRRAVKMEVKIEETEPSSKGKIDPEPVENYQIIKEPTTS